MGTLELVIAWIFSHVLSLFVFARKPLRSFVFVFIILIILIVYANKPDAYDLNWYLPYFKAPYPRNELEFAFYFISAFNAYILGFSARETLFFWQLIIFVFFFGACRNFGARGYLVVSAVILMSVMFALSTQGAIRQGISSSLLFYALSLYYRFRSRYLSVFIGIISTFFHASGFQFYIIGRLLMYFSLNSRSSVRSLRTGFFLMFVLGLLAYLYMSNDVTYGSTDFDGGESRTSSFVKLIALAVTLLISEFIAGNDSSERDTVALRKQRFLYFVFLIPVSFTSEGFSRLAYFYYAIDMILAACLLSSARRQRNLLAGIFILLTYSVAPNAINIITGLGQPEGAYDNSF